MSLQHSSVSNRVKALYLIVLLTGAGMLVGSFINETFFTSVQARRSPMPPLSITSLGTPISQNFDTLATSGTANAWTDDATLAGWYSQFGLQPANPTTYRADSGSGTTGAIYSYGNGANTDRAFGSLSSGTPGDIFIATKATNSTGSTITSLNISYVGEQWRNGGNTSAQQLDFQYRVATPGTVTDANTPSTGWTDFDPLDFVSPITGATAAALDGNAAADRTARSANLAVTINNGQEVWLRWKDTNDTGNDHGLAIDDFSVTAFAPPDLTINDVSLNEGNSGTTAFTFTVSLSSAAGPAGVTFDIATQDNSATEPGDYTTKTLTAQSIPSGGTSTAFAVSVNGDAVPEPNETFFVNVTNVTGANTIDGTGVGTIQNDDAAANLTINDVTLNEGNAGTTTFTFTVSLSAPAPAGGVTFDIATANNTAIAPGDHTAKALTGQTIPEGSSTYTFDMLVNGDLSPEADETFFANVTNVVNAIPVDGQGLGTIVNDDLYKIHDVQGNGTSTPLPGAMLTVEGVVVADFQGTNKLQGFFLEEEDVDADADPMTSEGVLVFCNTCPTPVAEGQRVRVTGTVSEFNGMTEITASSAGSVIVTDAGNQLAEVTPTVINLPVVGDIDSYYEAREGMLITYANTLTVSDYFQLSRFGQIELFQGGRPRQFTEDASPNVAGYTAHLDDLASRRVILDDDNNAQEGYLASTEGSQFIFYPQTNGGFSAGTQGADFFRGGDLVNGLTGVLHRSFPGFGADTWRIRPTAAHPVTFTVANPRPATPPAVGGAIKAVSMNLLNYFTTIDTTSASSSGPCGPSGTQDCRGADSVAELNRQRERASIVICGLNADVYGLMELENTTATGTITDLLSAVNARCGGAHPYDFVNTGGTLGSDAIRVMIIYRTGVLQPVGSPLVDLDPIHNRPPTAQTFDVIDPANPAFGRRFTVVANHFKSKGCDGSATGADADAGDGQSCYNARRTAQATRLLTWISGTVLPSAGDPDVLLLGDFNSYAKEDPVTTLSAGGFVDLASSILGPSSYSYLFDAQLGHLDYAFASSSLASKVTGVGNWHINADECDLFDYNDEIKDVGESSFEEKPDGSALDPPRVVFQPGTPYRASDHDPVIVGLFQISDLAITKVDTPDPVTAGNNLTYTITVTNNGPDAASNASWSDTLPAGTSFVSLAAPSGWSCVTPAVGAGGTVSCSNPLFAVGSAVFTIVVKVDPSVLAGTVLTNTATTTSSIGDGNPSNGSVTATTTVAASADLMVTKVDTPDPVTAGANLTYTITVTNAGPSNAASVSLSDTLQAGTTFLSLSSPGGWSCTAPAVGTGGTVSCSTPSQAVGNAVFTLTVAVASSVTSGTVLSNTATTASATSDPNPGNESDAATTTVAASADLSVTKVDTPDPVTADTNLTYTITVTNAGPSAAASVSLTDTLPAGTTFVSLSSPGGWSCTTPSVGAGGTVSCSNPSLGVGSTVFTLTVAVGPSVSAGTVLSNTATASSATSDPNPGNESGTATTTVGAGMADLAVTKSDAPDPVLTGATLTYTVAVSNAGPSSATHVVVTDNLPAQVTFVSCSSTGGGVCGGSGNNRTVIFDTLPVGAPAATITFTTTVLCSVANNATITNTASAASSSTDPNPNNNSSMATTTASNPAPTITCPANLIRGNDPNQCGAVVTYTNPAPVDNCSGSTVTCSPASGSFFPVGTTSVTCKATDAGWAMGACIFTITVDDTQPPVLTTACPGAINTAAQATCPFSNSGMVTYATPTASDNCPGVTVACVPPPGSMFPVGTTSVTCTATDTAGNTATCTFPVTVFNLCVQDNSNPGNVVLVNTSTGAYRFCCKGVLAASGTGTRNVKGCMVTIHDSSNNRLVQIIVDGSSLKGTAVTQGGSAVCTISDNNLQNNTCVCQ